MADLRADRLPTENPPGRPQSHPAFAAEREGRQHAEESLRQSEEAFRLLVDSVTDYAIFMLDPDGHVSTWNLGAQRLKGYRADEIIGMHFSTFYPEEAVARGWPQHELKVALAEGRFEDEGWRVRKDGSLFWANVVITTVRDAEGRLRGFSKVTRDLTERKRREEELLRARALLEARVEQRTAELAGVNEALRTEVEGHRQVGEALRASEWRSRTLMELLPVAVYTCDAPSGAIRYYNRRATELWGREPAVGDTDERFCGSLRLLRPDGTLLPHAETPMAKVLRGHGPVRDQNLTIERPDGARITVRVYIEPIRSDAGHVVGAINVFQDVTERERLFEELRQSEERFRQLVFALPAAVYTTDAAGRITLYNDEAARLWGRRPELGKDLWCGSFRIVRTDGTLLPQAESPMAVALREGREVRGEEIVVERPDGVRACVLPHPVLQFNAAGAVVGAVNMLVDITERKHTEEELRALERELREKVEALAAADRRKNEFLATLAHELRNPLAPLRHGLQLLHLAEGDEDVQRQARDMMERQLAQMVRLIDDLLDLARITNRKLRLQREPMDVTVAIRSALETVQPVVDEAGHELTVTLPPEPVVVVADSTRLAQVFVNLLHNAAKYTKRGGHIWLAAARQDQELVVSVRDTGSGITAEHLPHLFEMFSQVTPALERSEGGLGIGLSLVRGLVELHGGTVEAHSEGLGHGSEFVVRLPVHRAPAPERQERAGAEDPSPGCASRRRILVSDDNRDSAEGLGILLTLEGYEVRTAHDGVEALEAVATFRPDVVLLDIGMPGLNGYEVARRIRQTPGGEHTILIAVTGWGQEEDKQRAKEAGFDHHLTKPVDAADLGKLLRSAGDLPGGDTEK